MSRTKMLADLQEVDLERDEVLSRLKHIVKALQGNPAVAEAQREVEDLERRREDVEHRYKHHEIERQDLKDHIGREEQKLYGGKVRVPKELASLQLEIESLKRRLGSLDDTALELMLERDAAADALAEAEADLERIASETETEAAELTKEKAELSARLRRLDEARAERREPLRPPDLALYERLRKTKKGRAVADLKGEHCGACGMQLPRTSLDQARSGTVLVQCPGCGRIQHG